MNKVEKLENIFEFKNPDDIKNFLSQNKKLIKILLDSAQKINSILGYKSHLQLEYCIDPEEGWDELFIIIKSSLPNKDIIKLEKELFYKWFIYVMDKTINLNYEIEPLE